MADDVDVLAGAVSEQICQKEPYYTEAFDRSQLVESVRPHILAILDAIGGDHGDGDPAPPRHTGRRCAEQGAPLAVVQRAYRLGMSTIWDELVGKLGSDPAATQHLLRSSASFWNTLDEHLEVLNAAYREHELEQTKHDQRLRESALTTLFHGPHGGGMAFSQAATILRLPTRGLFAVVAADPLTAGRSEGPASVSRTLAASGIHTVWRSDGDGEVGLVILTRGYSTERLAALLTGALLGRVGMSEVFTSVSEARSAASQARAARGAAPAGSNDVVRYELARLPVLLASTREVSAELIRDVLGGLDLLPSDEQEMLIGTLRAWFEAKGTTTEAARLLHCHPNTVRYRMAKLCQATGRTPTEPVDAAHLYLAMEARRLLGPVGPRRPQHD
ncbi:PucR family transcriptional regulator [Rhodococcus sp. 077-4]|uniref:PucR family transcriptional regulator n=1 Tax=Rhodococcus sp. 077-4 TaxID=2789271 RepID=UPI0039F502A2